MISAELRIPRRGVAPAAKVQVVLDVEAEPGAAS
jgi:hypothetical protein